MPKETICAAEVASQVRMDGSFPPSAYGFAPGNRDVVDGFAFFAPIRATPCARDDRIRLRGDCEAQAHRPMHFDGAVDRLLVSGRSPIHTRRCTRRSRVRHVSRPDPRHRRESSATEDPAGLQRWEPRRRRTGGHPPSPRNRISAGEWWAQRAQRPGGKRNPWGAS
jgi:hypothetical protein